MWRTVEGRAQTNRVIKPHIKYYIWNSKNTLRIFWLAWFFNFSKAIQQESNQSLGMRVQVTPTAWEPSHCIWRQDIHQGLKCVSAEPGLTWLKSYGRKAATHFLIKLLATADQDVAMTRPCFYGVLKGSWGTGWGGTSWDLLLGAKQTGPLLPVLHCQVWLEMLAGYRLFEA